ncbi:hypothetical protein LTR10_024061 [Elasticomyces elasticus]|uniref:Amidohydrolase-related domain-containing protein n=1 Tax=Exophiala sideris TaxID=1016849 RepID=A0ABR0JP15_9EURO|nr:hypothetical protein LTR10_024061 [Elasticomyces elasticus]KAK5038174.1 hypothetical protein LTS07_001643 [Exophiala sideris]KAK5044158.1 hypothetical protein LTR13_000514 [Exophiala sideris]KAK5067658.1 hypothetical protein LTR69_001647 [Exophiala sideris]KAK5184101.1 hypothetical protein LTR44_003607 [Eurotiomycetes sp. CCFEE 6388]
MSKVILRNGTVLAYDENSASIKVLRRASVVVEGDRIAAILDADSSKDNNHSEAEIVDVTGHIVAPGLVNTHCHMWQTAYRTLGPDITLAQYFSWGPKDVYIGSLEGYIEGINAGVTSFLEHAHNNWQEQVVENGLKAAQDSGARIWWCYHPFDRDNFPLDEQYRILKNLKSETRNSGDLVRFGLAMDGLDSMSDGSIQQAKQLARELEAEALTAHYLGGPWPFAQHLPELAAEHEIEDLKIPFVWSHAGFVSSKDIDLLRQHDQHISITPESEMHYGHGQDTSRFIHDQASLGIDTQWTFSGDILLQARLWLQYVRGHQSTEILKRGHIPNQTPMSVMDAFLLATRNGGRALHRDDIGVLKVGAKADIVCFDGRSPNMLGWTDPVAAVVLHSNIADIKHVMIGGQFRKRNGKLILKSGNWEEMSVQFTETAQRIQQAFRVPPPLPESIWGKHEFEDVPNVSASRLEH